MQAPVAGPRAEPSLGHEAGDKPSVSGHVRGDVEHAQPVRVVPVVVGEAPVQAARPPGASLTADRDRGRGRDPVGGRSLERQRRRPAGDALGRLRLLRAFSAFRRSCLGLGVLPASRATVAVPAVAAVEASADGTLMMTALATARIRETRVRLTRCFTWCSFQAVGLEGVSRPSPQASVNGCSAQDHDLAGAVGL